MDDKGKRVLGNLARYLDGGLVRLLVRGAAVQVMEQCRAWVKGGRA